MINKSPILYICHTRILCHLLFFLSWTIIGCITRAFFCKLSVIGHKYTTPIPNTSHGVQNGFHFKLNFRWDLGKPITNN